jgi:hypothetical protein
MADTKQQTTPADTQPWDARQYEEALAQLGKLQAQVRVPRVY